MSGQILVGRSNRRVPSSIARPDVTPTILPPPIPTLASRDRRRMSHQPRFGTLMIPDEREDEGPPNGLTLDDALALLQRENLNLRAKRLEIPQAEADILTAGLRANPFLYGDGQLLPYGQFDPKNNPGGPSQYDANVTLPIDWNLKRRSRLAVARRARNVVQALYQNAVRLEVANLYSTYVDALAARETARYAHGAIESIDTVLTTEKERRKAAADSRLEFDQIALQREAARLGFVDADAAFRSSQRRLAVLLHLPIEQAPTLALRGSLHDRQPPAPPVEELVAMALASRPDLAAFRLGIERAKADIALAKANRFSDLYLLYQPYTYQNNQPYGSPSSRSWALGATVSVPLWDRNQGNIRRSTVNLQQTRIETRGIEQQAIGEVHEAYQEYIVTRQMVERIEDELLPQARRVLDDNLELYRQGQVQMLNYLSAQRDYGEVVRQYRDILVRHRRAMLDLNTAVGERVLP